MNKFTESCMQLNLSETCEINSIKIMKLLLCVLCPNPDERTTIWIAFAGKLNGTLRQEKNMMLFFHKHTKTSCVRSQWSRKMINAAH